LVEIAGGKSSRKKKEDPERRKGLTLTRVSLCSNDVNLKILAIPNLAGCGTHTLTDSECVLAYQVTLSG